MPEGDALHRAARRLQVLVGERVEVETPHPQAQVERLAERLDGAPARGVEAVGKNLLLHFEGGLVLRSHLRMRGRWQVRARNGGSRGRPWLVLRGAEREAVLWNGPVLELHGRGTRRLGPDILADPPDFDAMLARLSPRRPESRGRRGAPRPEAGRRASATSGRPRRSGAPGLAVAEARRRHRRRAPSRSCIEPRSADAQLTRLEGRGARRLPAASGARAPAAGRRSARGARARRTGSRYWCPECQEGAARPGRNWSMGVRAPQLHSALRGFCLGAFAFFGARARRAAPTSRSRSRSTPLATGRRSTSTGRSSATSSRRAPDGSSRSATPGSRLEELRREPAAAIFARAHAGDDGRRAGALPHRPAAARRGHRRGLRRVRLGRRRRSTARTPRSRRRSSGTSGATRPSRRSSASRPAAHVELGGGVARSTGRRRRVAHALAGRRAARAARLRSRDRPHVRARAGARSAGGGSRHRTRRASSPTP